MDERRDVKNGKESKTYKKVMELMDKGYGLIESSMDITPEDEDTLKAERKPEEES